LYKLHVFYFIGLLFKGQNYIVNKTSRYHLNMSRSGYDAIYKHQT